MGLDASTAPLRAMGSGEAARRVVGPKGLPRGYNKAARRWIAFMVSTPIALVSSWWVYERVVLGKEPKNFATDFPAWLMDSSKKEENAEKRGDP